MRRPGSVWERLGRKLVFNAPVSLSFAFLSFVVLILSELTGGSSNRLLFSVYRCPLNRLSAFLRFFFHVLGHQNYAHFSGNMLLVLVLGPSLEERYGSLNILYCILITAFLTGLVQFVFFPSSAVLGASGIVFMMIVLSSMVGVSDRRLPVTALLVLVFYLGEEIIEGLFTSDNISHLSHVIGGLCGAVFGFALSGRWARRPR